MRLATAASIGGRLGTAASASRGVLVRSLFVSRIGRVVIDRVNHLAHQIDTAMKCAIRPVLIAGGHQLALTIQRLKKLIEQRAYAVSRTGIIRNSGHGDREYTPI